MSARIVKLTWHCPAWSLGVRDNNRVFFPTFPSLQVTPPMTSQNFKYSATFSTLLSRPIVLAGPIKDAIHAINESTNRENQALAWRRTLSYWIDRQIRSHRENQESLMVVDPSPRMSSTNQRTGRIRCWLADVLPPWPPDFFLVLVWP